MLPLTVGAIALVRSMIIHQLIIYILQTSNDINCVYLNFILYSTIVLRVKEVLPNSNRTLGIEVNGNYISLPGELFKNLNESGI